MPNLPWNNDDDEKSISECFYLSFDIGTNMEIPTAAVLKQSSNGVHLVRLFQCDEALDLYEFVTGEEIR